MLPLTMNMRRLGLRTKCIYTYIYIFLYCLPRSTWEQAVQKLEYNFNGVRLRERSTVCCCWSSFGPPSQCMYVPRAYYTVGPNLHNLFRPLFIAINTIQNMGSKRVGGGGCRSLSNVSHNIPLWAPTTTAHSFRDDFGEIKPLKS